MLLLLPFELLTGHAVERLVERSEQSLAGWLLDWSRGAGRYLFASWCAGLAYGYGAGLWWPWRFGLTLALLAVCLVAAEYHFRSVRALGGRRTRRSWPTRGKCRPPCWNSICRRPLCAG